MSGANKTKKRRPAKGIKKNRGEGGQGRPSRGDDLGTESSRVRKRRGRTVNAEAVRWTQASHSPGQEDGRAGMEGTARCRRGGWRSGCPGYGLCRLSKDLGVYSGCSGSHCGGSHRGRICVTLYNQVSRPTACGPHPTLSWLNQQK